VSFPPYPYPAPIIPAGIAITVGDSLRFVVVSNSVNTYKATVNMVAPDGSAASTSLSVTTTSNRVQAVAREYIAFRATIVSASMELQNPGNSPTGPGNTYVLLLIDRGGSTVIDQVFGGYYYFGHNPSYPPGMLAGISGEADSPKGRVYNVHTASTPLLAAGVAFGPPAFTLWKVSAFRIKLITSNTVGNRLILVYMTDGTAAPVSGTEGTNVIEEWVNNNTFGTGRTVAASTTEIYKATGYQTVDASATINKIIQTPFFMSNSNGFQLFIQDTAAIDAVNDKVTIDATVEEWLTG
jgi:hypothetical protein